mmetsp:Transcript_38270/g.70215  ORF Transcript_38270/g.70215 Transcript_38270/m.70215 type:complete len:94 (-) Transcript_38270:2396-2677(-)
MAISNDSTAAERLSSFRTINANHHYPTNENLLFYCPRNNKKESQENSHNNNTNTTIVHDNLTSVEKLHLQAELNGAIDKTIITIYNSSSNSNN